MLPFCLLPILYGEKILPFFILGIGLDGSFLLKNAYERSGPNKSTVDRIEDTMDEVGFSIAMTSFYVLTCICAWLLLKHSISKSRYSMMFRTYRSLLSISNSFCHHRYDGCASMASQLFWWISSIKSPSFWCYLVSVRSVLKPLEGTFFVVL